jgi:hypothetical protein
MPVNENQLRQLLVERSDPARERPVPQERITARIRRVRVQRAAGAGLLALVVAAGVVTGMNLARAPGHAASYSGSQLPASFTASDGAAYRQLSVTSMTDLTQRSAALTITAGSDPVDVMASCEDPASGVFIGVKVNGVMAGLIRCQDPPQLMGLSVRPGLVAHITFVRGSSLGLPDIDTGWQFAAYAWTPPAALRAAPAEPRLPPSYIGPNTTAGQGTASRRLIASRSGDWPGDRTATFTVTYHRGRNIDVSVVCAGAIATRLQVSFQVDGSKGQVVPCKSWTPAQPPQETTTISGRADVPITLTFRFQAPSPATAAAYAKRAASWTIGIYEEQT